MVFPRAPVMLGSLLTLTGPLASTLGIADTNAVQMASELASVGGHPVQLVSADDGCSGTVAAQGAAQLAAADVVGVIGTTCSRAAAQADSVLAPLGITLFSPSNTNLLLTEPGSALPFYARAFNDGTEAAPMATFARDQLGVQRVAIVADHSNSYSTRLADNFAAAVTSAGLTVTSVQSIDCSTMDCGDAANLQPAVGGIVAAGIPDLIFAPLTSSTASAALAEAVRARPELASTKLMGGDADFDPTLISIAGPAAEGFLVEGIPAIPAGFAAQYTARFGTSPSHYSAMAFDETNILLAAANSVLVQRGSGADSMLFIPRSALYGALLATSGYVGAAGTYTCAEPGFNVGDCLNHPVFAVYQVQNGAFVQIFP